VDIWFLLRSVCTSLLLCTEALFCWMKKSFPTFNIIIDRTLSLKSSIYSVDRMEKDRRQLGNTIIHTMPPPPWHCLLHLTTCSWHDTYVLQSSGPSSENRFSSLKTVRSHGWQLGIQFVMISSLTSLSFLDNTICDFAFTYLKPLHFKCLWMLLVEIFK